MLKHLMEFSAVDRTKNCSIAKLNFLFSSTLVLKILRFYRVKVKKFFFPFHFIAAELNRNYKQKKSSR